MRTAANTHESLSNTNTYAFPNQSHVNSIKTLYMQRKLTRPVNPSHTHHLHLINDIIDFFPSLHELTPRHKHMRKQRKSRRSAKPFISKDFIEELFNEAQEGRMDQPMVIHSVLYPAIEE